MELARQTRLDRRKILKIAGTSAFAAICAPAVHIGQAKASDNQLRILRWKNFVPAAETWFNDVFVREWGDQNDVDVIVENVGLGEINQYAANEIEAQDGHDLVLFLSPRAAIEDHVIDHGDIVAECETLYGSIPDFVRKSCYNPKTGRFHSFPESLLATMLTYRKDLWDAVGKTPDSWDDIRRGGRAIKLLHGAPVGISLASEHNGEHSLRALLYSFGGFVQDAEGQPIIDSRNSREALSFAKALFEEAMTSEVLSWTPPSNNQHMLAGSGSLTVDTMSIIRAAENKKLPVNENLALKIMPEGPNGRIAPMFGLNTYVIWKFAKNQNSARKFLIDYVGRFRESFLKGGFQNMPVYPDSVPNSEVLVLNDPGISQRYAPLLDANSTLSNLGYPGYSNAAIDEVMGMGLVTKMFASVASGANDPDTAVQHASSLISSVFEKWYSAGKI